VTGRRSLALAAALLATGCGSYVQTILYADGAPTARGPNCVVEVYENNQVPPAGLVAFGDVFVGDTGFTYFCTELSVQSEIRRRACAAGAEAVHLLTTRSALTSCRQTRALLLRRETMR
jgi:hypothetical protein